MAINETMIMLKTSVQNSYLSFLASNNYLFAASILIASIITAMIVSFIIDKFLKALTKKTKSELDDDLIELIHKPTIYVISLLGVYFSVETLNFSSISSITLKIVISIVYLVVAGLLIKVINRLLDEWSNTWAKKTKSTLDDDLIPLLSKANSVAFYIIAGIMILSVWNIEIGPFIASLGIAGLAIGFAVKDSLANIFGGIQMILDRAYKIGDMIQIESGEVGTIHDIGLRSTRIKTFTNEIIVVPNAQMANSKVTNFVQPEKKVRCQVNFGVEYGSDIKKVEKIALSALKKTKNILDEPAPQVLFVDMADSSLNFFLRFWVPTYKERFSTEVKIRGALYDALNKAKIGIPFPTHTVYLEK